MTGNSAKAAALTALLVLSACMRPDAESVDREDTQRPQPSVTTPGVTVSGYAEVGVIRGF